MPAFVTMNVAERVATITLDSQHNRNALSKQLLAELHACLDEAVRAQVRAIVFRHEGPAFCAGADLKEQSNEPTDPTAFVSVLERLMDATCPTISAVDGAVRAGGIGLMASCDLVVVNETTTFALTEVRIGVAPAIISVPILRRVPAGKIAAAMLTGESFDAPAAREMGLVTHVSADVAGTVDQLTSGVRAGAPRAVRETKALLHSVPQNDRTSAFAAMASLSAELFGSPEAELGMAAFRQKQRPDWSDLDG